VITNNAGIALIKKFEGLRLRAYYCPRGKLTIGFGHTGPDVHLGQQINEREAEQLLRGDLLQFEHGVEEFLDGVPASFNEFSAMVCLAYNIGLGNFRKSSVLKFHRQGKKLLAANAFLLWVNSGKLKHVPGLIRRRNAERGLYVA
jgi:lysozyme